MKITKSTKALILVDLENEWADKKSDYYAGNLSDLIKKTNKLIDYCRKKKYKIIFIRHVEKGSSKFFIANHKSTALLPGLHKRPADKIVTKYAIGSFYKTNLEKELKGTKNIVVGGILTNLCVRSLVSDAYDRGFGITIVKDCCVALDKKTHEFTLKDLKATREEIEMLDLKSFTK